MTIETDFGGEHCVLHFTICSGTFTGRRRDPYGQPYIIDPACIRI